MTKHYIHLPKQLITLKYLRFGTGKIRIYIYYLLPEELIANIIDFKLGIFSLFGVIVIFKCSNQFNATFRNPNLTAIKENRLWGGRPGDVPWTVRP